MRARKKEGEDESGDREPGSVEEGEFCAEAHS
jgi:hypothetical protein